jgi:arylsulfatase A-like enzyme
MPLLVRWPGRVAAGSENRDIVLNLDFASTLLAAAHVPVPQGMQGRSFVPLLDGKAPPDWRTSMYYRYYLSHFATEPHYGVRTQTHKLIYFDRLKQWELFDLEQDPLELNNVYGNPAYADLAKQLHAELLRLQQKYRDDPADVGNKPRTGFEPKS